MRQRAAAVAMALLAATLTACGGEPHDAYAPIPREHLSEHYKVPCDLVVAGGRSASDLAEESVRWYFETALEHAAERQDVLSKGLEIADKHFDDEAEEAWSYLTEQAGVDMGEWGAAMALHLAMLQHMQAEWYLFAAVSVAAGSARECGASISSDMGEALEEGERALRTYAVEWEDIWPAVAFPVVNALITSWDELDAAVNADNADWMQQYETPTETSR